MQAYADVLRKAPAMTDAAFNYEYVVKLRDRIAKAPARRAAAAEGRAASTRASTSRSVPPSTAAPVVRRRRPPMGDFKTVTPMRYDEREEQTDPGRGQKLQRKG